MVQRIIAEEVSEIIHIDEPFDGEVIAVESLKTAGGELAYDVSIWNEDSKLRRFLIKKVKGENNPESLIGTRTLLTNEGLSFIKD